MNQIIISINDSNKYITVNDIVRIFNKEEKRFVRIRAQYLKIGENVYNKENKFVGYCLNNDFIDIQDRQDYMENSNEYYNINY